MGAVIDEERGAGQSLDALTGPAEPEPAAAAGPKEPGLSAATDAAGGAVNATAAAAQAPPDGSVEGERWGGGWRCGGSGR